ncbi:hypothetical protein CERSUDRAFT_96694 [Gelatoporia subvermispora B]|uniref:Uncharacterized protein n=1 Tax=Ceriporiopsis subvermispora (strain B) TaxID=914234 RepID=M2RAY5_CERS8|nr:hypothetical protein CERSUDRAFT_96694 [Gelatoporia subvermispora B]
MPRALLSLNALDIIGRISTVFDYTSMFTVPLSSIIISHFLLDLHQTANVSMGDGNSASVQQDGELDQNLSQVSAPVLSSFLSNIGEFIDYVPSNCNEAIWDDVEDVQRDTQNADIDHHTECELSNDHTALAGESSS